MPLRRMLRWSSRLAQTQRLRPELNSHQKISRHRRPKPALTRRLDPNLSRMTGSQVFSGSRQQLQQGATASQLDGCCQVERLNCCAIHDRMPVIIAPRDYGRWLSPLDPDPRDLLVPYPSEPRAMWPISTRVNKPENDDASILERVDERVGIIAK